MPAFHDSGPAEDRHNGHNQPKEKRNEPGNTNKAGQFAFAIGRNSLGGLLRENELQRHGWDADGHREKSREDAVFFGAHVVGETMNDEIEKSAADVRDHQPAALA